MGPLRRLRDHRGTYAGPLSRQRLPGRSYRPARRACSKACSWATRLFARVDRPHRLARRRLRDAAPGDHHHALQVPGRGGGLFRPRPRHDHRPRTRDQPVCPRVDGAAPLSGITVGLDLGTLSRCMWMLRSSEPVLSFRLLPGMSAPSAAPPASSSSSMRRWSSRVHCRLTLSADGNLTVEDLGSTNGTYVNDLRVEAATAAACRHPQGGPRQLRGGTGDFRRGALGFAGSQVLGSRFIGSRASSLKPQAEPLLADGVCDGTAVAAGP